MSKTKKKANKNQNSGAKKKEPKFIIEKDGKAYFKDKPIALVCRPAKIISNAKYPGFMYEYDYMANLKSFKKFVILMASNGGGIKYVGMTEQEFLSLGGEAVGADGFEEMNAAKLRRKQGFFKI